MYSPYFTLLVLAVDFFLHSFALYSLCSSLLIKFSCYSFFLLIRAHYSYFSSLLFQLKHNLLLITRHCSQLLVPSTKSIKITNCSLKIHLQGAFLFIIVSAGVLHVFFASFCSADVLIKKTTAAPRKTSGKKTTCPIISSDFPLIFHVFCLIFSIKIRPWRRAKAWQRTFVVRRFRRPGPPWTVRLRFQRGTAPGGSFRFNSALQQATHIPIWVNIIDVPNFHWLVD